jgi:hypothetical protein
VFMGSLGLFWTKACVGKFGFISVIFILLCINPLFANLKCLYFVYLNSGLQTLVPCCPRECSWSLGPVGTVGQV